VTATIDDAGLRDLGERIAGEIVLPGDVAWDAARQAWNLAVDQRPVAVVYPCRPTTWWRPSDTPRL
jgi:hypothetical protein